MRKLHILYDARCGFCRRCRRLMEAAPAFLELEFVPAGSGEALRRFPGAAEAGDPRELVVVSDEGGVYRGAHAWIMCLYALENYREWADVLSRPALLPVARQAFELLSANRHVISCWFDSKSEEELAEAFRREAYCSEACDAPVAAPRAHEETLPEVLRRVKAAGGGTAAGTVPAAGRLTPPDRPRPRPASRARGARAWLLAGVVAFLLGLFGLLFLPVAILAWGAIWAWAVAAD